MARGEGAECGCDHANIRQCVSASTSTSASSTASTSTSTSIVVAASSCCGHTSSSININTNTNTNTSWSSDEPSAEGDRSSDVKSAKESSSARGSGVLCGVGDAVERTQRRTESA